jgi:hypothetical protein
MWKSFEKKIVSLKNKLMRRTLSIVAYRIHYLRISIRIQRFKADANAALDHYGYAAF